MATASVRGGPLMQSAWVRIWLGAGIVLLMTVHPNLRMSAVTLVAFGLAAWATASLVIPPFNFARPMEVEPHGANR